jgi:putative DNA primase/helicase
MSNNPFAPIGAGGGRAPKRKAWTNVVPVPADAPAPPTDHFKLGKPTSTWTYLDAANKMLGYVLRFDGSTGEKQFRPLTLWRNATGNLEWRWESWPVPRPLYGLQQLAALPCARVVVTEGEKAADAVTQLLPDVVAVTGPNGSKSASKADWSPLRGRDVIIWPDADSPGLEYANAVAKHLVAVGAKSVSIVSPPKGVTVAWDAANAIAEGWDAARASKLIAAARSISPRDDVTSDVRDHVPTQDGSGGRRRTPQRDILISLVEPCEFWHDANRTAYVTFPVNAHKENWPVRSREVRIWLSSRYYEETGTAIGGQALEDGIRILEARAVNEGPRYDPFVRVAQHNGHLFIDLGDTRWCAAKIAAIGWSIDRNPPLKFLRSSSMRPLPEPERGGMIEELREFLNVRSDDDFMLAIAWLVAALSGRGPYPVLVLNGEQGTGKSVFSRMIRSLVDPSAAAIRSVPKDDRDLVVSASNSHVLAFDNLSGVPGWFADALARLATRSGFATRMLHTDRDEFIFEGARPIVLNGIPTLTDRADLADRAVTIHLAVIPEEARQPEEELFAAFEARRATIFGALLDALAAALRNLPTVRLERAPRMADFARLITAAEPGLGWKPGTFLKIYGENRRDVMEASIEAEPVAKTIIDHFPIDHPYPAGFIATPTELLAVLNSRANDGVRKSRIWPDSAQRLGNRIDRIAPLLRSRGFVVERRHSGQRLITIIPPKRAD